MNASLKTIITLAISSICISGLAQFSAQVDSLWGKSVEQIKGTLPKEAESLHFKLSDKQQYSNMIIDHMKSLDDDIGNKISVLQSGTSPQRDYIFVDGKLSSIYENWGAVESDKELSIRNHLAKHFGKVTVHDGGTSTVCSFMGDKTRVFFLTDKVVNGQAKCSIYYYTKRLFSFLLLQ